LSPGGRPGRGSPDADHDGDRAPGAGPVDRGRRLLRIEDVGLVAPAYAIPGLASFATVPVLFVALGAAEFGVWALLYGIAAGVPQVTTSWLEATVLRFGHRSGRASVRWRVALAVAGSIACSSVMVVVIVPGAGWLEVLAGAALTTVVSLYVLTIARLQSALAFGRVSVAASARAVLGAGLAMLGAVVTGVAAVAVLGLATGYVIGGLMGSIGRAGAAPATAVPPASAGISSRPPERLAYGLSSGAAAVASYALSVGDRFILSALRPLAEVGTYTATYALVDLAGRFLPSIVLVVARPRVFRAWDDGRRAELDAALIGLAAVAAWAVAGATVALLALARIVPGLPVEPGLVGPIGVGMAASAAANAIGLRYSAATRQTRLAGHLVIAAAVNIGLNAILIPDHGASGAAAVTAISYVLLVALHVGGVGVRPARDAIAIGITVATAAAFAALSSLALRPDADWPLLVAAVALAVVGPLVVVAWRRIRASG
jgi:O-antigen/teichoic acid export membrane protein